MSADRDYLERRRADRRLAGDRAVTAYEACQRREDRRKAKAELLERVRIAHWMARFDHARINASLRPSSSASPQG